MPRWLRACLLAAGAAIVLTGPALAAKPDRYLLPTQDPFVLPAGSGACDFDVSVEVTVNREYELDRFFRDGSLRIMVEGSVTYRLTNLEPGGRSLDWNAGGPGYLDFDADGNATAFGGHGHVLLLGPAAPVQDDGIYDYTGNVDFLSGAWTGTRTDVCAALAS